MSFDQRFDAKWQQGGPVTVRTNTRTLITIQREVIPIVFVPGIMGTRLRNRDAGTWDPNSSLFMVWNHGGFWVSAKERQNLLLGESGTYVPGYAWPDEGDEGSNADLEEKYPGATKRGWGSLFWDSYQPILGGLHDAQWPEGMRRSFLYPVHAFGYDWRAPVRDAGWQLAERVRGIIESYKKTNECNQVILVTHSMGGLVARSACKQHGLEKEVLGVVHVVQPTTGASAAYWRMKCGFERSPSTLKGYATAWTLGADGQEVTALLCNMPGGLTLLPSKKFGTNVGRSAWLTHVDGEGREQRLPRSDPYQEIYESTTADYRLVRFQDYLAGAERGTLSVANRKIRWKSFLKHIKDAKSFHAEMDDYQHANSHHIYGSEGATTDEIRLTTKQIRHQRHPKVEPPKTYIAERGGFRDCVLTSTGSVATGDVYTCLEMNDAEGKGDGTVPEHSAHFLKASDGGGVRIVKGDVDYERTATAIPDANHQDVFQKAEAIDTTKNAIIALVRHKIRTGRTAEAPTPQSAPAR